MSSLAQLILVGLLATCVTAIFVEETEVIPGYPGQPKWTWKMKLNYLELVRSGEEMKSYPFTFIVNGQFMDLTIGFKHAPVPTSNLQMSLIVSQKNNKPYSFRMKGSMTLHNQNGFSDTVGVYDWSFSSRRMFPIDYLHPYRSFANKSVILDPANGWIKDGSILTTITFDYLALAKVTTL